MPSIQHGDIEPGDARHSDIRRGDVAAAPTAELDAVTLYRILRLRSEVFVVEQDCVYLDQDGRDLEPGAQQLWIDGGDTNGGDTNGGDTNGGDDVVLATLRILRDPDGRARIGRVATARAARGRGLAVRLMQRALELCGDGEIVLDAQSYLLDWYAGFGFVRVGEEFLEDGIPHVTMRRPAPGTS